ncbi:MAG: DHH family phosphoesterase [Firmicutes bacterium]|nr:DHH family phosphoesterase [Bacillota bacterium]
MNSKFFQNLMKPYFRISMVVVGLLSIVLLFFNLYAGIAGGLVCIGMFLFYRSYTGIKGDDLKKYVNELLREVDATSREFITRDPRGLCLVGGEGTILWFNDKFGEIYETAEFLRSNITETTGIRPAEIRDKVDTDRYNLVLRKDRAYRVKAFSGHISKQDVTLLYWTDVTALETLKNLYNEEKVCYGILVVDNYDEILSSASDDTRAVLAAQIETVIRQWASRHSATVVKPRSHRYFLTFEQKDFERMEAGRFSILDDVRAIESSAEFPVSVSIGIGVGGKNLVELEEYANAALDLALGRGGDQAVVKKKSKVEYYGGKLETVEKRNKGKSRIFAHALRQLMDQSDMIFVMGHRNPDMDSFGAAQGICAIARERGKEAYIVMDGYEGTLAKLVEKAPESGHRIISGDDALSLAEKDSLMVVVDTNRPSLLDRPELLSVSEKVVVIDHHRKSEDSIENPVLAYMETYASSACELITEILQYSVDGKKIIDKNEAEALLAGISLDTKNFSIKTGVRTFEAASWLRRNGADTVRVRQLFQNGWNETKIRAAIVAGAEVLPNGVAIASCEEQGPDIHIILSKAADALLNVDEVKASVVIGKNEKGGTMVSARSLGEINVQTAMEKLGGGGHLTMAGAQPEGTVEEVLKQVRELFAEEE